jgi:hypothetical protein
VNQQSIAAPKSAARPIRLPASPLRVGLAIAIFVIVVHAVGGNFANEWDGWGVALENMSAALVFGVVAAALTFGVLVRIGLRIDRKGPNRAARAGLATGVIGILSYVAFFTGAPAIVGAGAITLGLEGLRLARDGRGGRAPAVTGLALGIANVAVALTFYAAELTSGILEHWV